MRLEYIKDIANNNYVGINIYTDMVNPFLEKMRNILGDEYDEYVKHQQNRDRGHYHCTVLNVMEYNDIAKHYNEKISIIDNAINTLDIIDFKLLGIGSVERNGNKSFFIVCRSEQLRAFRKSLSKEDIDFHITLGFKYKDVFGLRKNQILPDVEPFLNRLKDYYHGFFSFLKELEDYDYDLNKDIYCTKIKDTYAEFKVSNEEGVVDYFIISLINNNLKITCRRQDSETVPYLSDTIISRKLG